MSSSLNRARPGPAETRAPDLSEMPHLVAQLYLARNQSMDLFNRGLHSDERDRHRDAMSQYANGIAVIDSALQTLRLTPQQWGWGGGQPKQWRQQMLKHRHMFARRRAEISEIMKQQRRQPRSVTSSGGRPLPGRTLPRHSSPNHLHQPTDAARVGGAEGGSSSSARNQESTGRQWWDRLSSFFSGGSASCDRAVESGPMEGPSCPQQTRRCTNPQRQLSVQPSMQQQQQQQQQRWDMRPKSAQVRGPQNQRGRRSFIQSRRDALADYPEFRGIDRKLLNSILDEVLEAGPNVSWDDVVGLKDAKQTLVETVIWPSMRPDLFSGLRKPARGVLLFGPPGNGKTFLAKAVASQCRATFFSISSSAIMSKYHGEGEKIVRALFAAARHLSPSVIFIDEVDSMLSARSSDEHEASRRIKTEFLVQMDGISEAGNEGERLLVLAATNRPDELDEAVLRRFSKRIMIPLPDDEARGALLMLLMRSQKHTLSAADFRWLVRATRHYSNADLRSLCAEAAMAPIRELGPQLLHVRAQDVRPVHLTDFEAALRSVKPSVSTESLRKMEEWNAAFGSFD